MKAVGKFEVLLMLFIMAIVGCATIPNAISEMNRKEVVAIDSLPVVVDSVIDSVIFVSKNNKSFGSGVVLTEDTIITAKHLIAGGDQIFDVTLWNGKTYKVIDSWVHKTEDIGFLKIAEPILKPAKFGSIKHCMLAEEIFVISSQLGARNFNTVTSGIISGMNRDWFGSYPWKNAFTIDASIWPGSSGGPVFTVDGVVRGIVVGGQMPTLTYCIPTDSFMEFRKAK